MRMPNERQRRRLRPAKCTTYGRSVRHGDGDGPRRQGRDESDALASAPRVKQSEWLDETSSKWRSESDRYWGNTRTAEPGNMPKPKDR